MYQGNAPSMPSSINTSGLEEFKTSVEGLELVSFIEYEDEEGDGWNEPHYDECCGVMYVLLNGADITEIVSEKVTETIAERFLEHIKDKKDQALISQQEDNLQSRGLAQCL